MTKKLKAITLMETIVYIAVFTLFMLTLMSFFLSIQVNQDKIAKEIELEMNNIFITNHLESTVGDNFAFDEINSTYDENNSTLVFINNQETLKYKILNGNLVLEKGLEINEITNKKAVIESLSFETFNLRGEIQAVKIHISVAHRDEAKVKKDLSTLINLSKHEN